MAHGDVLCTLLISSEMSLSKGSFSCASDFISAAASTLVRMSLHPDKCVNQILKAKYKFT